EAVARWFGLRRERPPAFARWPSRRFRLRRTSRRRGSRFTPLDPAGAGRSPRRRGRDSEPIAARNGVPVGGEALEVARGRATPSNVQDYVAVRLPLAGATRTAPSGRRQ